MSSVGVWSARIAAVRKSMAAQGLPGLLVTTRVNIGWLTGFTGSNGFVLLTQSDAIFATDSRYTEQAATQCAGYLIENLRTSAPDEITSLLARLGVPAIGFEADDLTFQMHSVYRETLAGGVSLVPTVGVIAQLRMIKDTGEIAAVEAAVAVADQTWDHIVPSLKPGAVERDVMLEMEWFMRRDCGAEVAFDIIVASGPRSALPHGRASTRVMESGDLVTLDFGARLNEYNSDITRTVVLGEPTMDQRKVYGIVRDALYRSIDAIRPGVGGKQVDSVGRDFITEVGYGENFGHGLGHGLGRAVHDSIAFSVRSETTIQENMVVTVEPGIYIPGWGGVRIEHDVVVTHDGARILDRTPTELLAL